MNKSKIEWCDYTWNPVTGCLHGCPYCYARRIANRFIPKKPLGDDCCQPNNKKLHEIRYKSNQPFRYGFEPTLHPYRLSEPLGQKKPSRIFVGSMCDLFGLWVPDEWIKKILRYVKRCPHHTFMFLTQNPNRYYFFDFPENCWLGTTTTGGVDAGRVDERQQDINIETVHAIRDRLAFVSIEPLLFNSVSPYIFMMDWIIIGLLSGNGAQRKPKRKIIEYIINVASDNNIPVFMKNSLKDIWKGKLTQEFPIGRNYEQESK